MFIAPKGHSLDRHMGIVNNGSGFGHPQKDYVVTGDKNEELVRKYGTKRYTD